MNLRNSLRARLAVLYACLLLGSGIVLLVLADLPLTTYGRAGPAHTGRAGSGQSRLVSNLPEVLGYSGIALAVLAVASVVLGWLVADRALRPLRAITAAARATSASTLNERLGPAGSYAYDEFRELGDTLDGLFARLEASFESQRHFVASASHELRTPLAAERAVLQVALADPDASAESLRAACRQLLDLGQQQEQLIDALLTLASSQRGLLHREPFDLAEVTSRVTAGQWPEADRRGVRLETRLDPAPVTGDASLAGSLVANLVGNAIRHNVTGGQAQVQVATGARAGRACLSVANSGPVVPAAEVERLFEPFRQLGGERTGDGHGLGLAIVAAVVRAHDGELTARARPAGGLEITVTF